MPADPYARVAVYTDKPRLAGFTSDDNLKKIAGTPAVVAERLGKGAVLLYLDNPNFRGFWRGGSRLFLNGLFFGSLIDDTSEAAGAARGIGQGSELREADPEVRPTRIPALKISAGRRTRS